MEMDISIKVYISRIKLNILYMSSYFLPHKHSHFSREENRVNVAESINVEIHCLKIST